MSDGDGQVELIWLLLAIPACVFFKLPICVISDLNQIPFPESTMIF